MPFYNFYHALPLTPEQKQDLATAVTNSHSRIFSALTALVNVNFVDVSRANNFIAGEIQKVPNTVEGKVRTGGGRTREMYEQMCEELIAAWDKIVRRGNTEVGPDELRVALMGGLVCLVEGGYLIPEAGKDQAWFEEHLPVIEKRAAAGHRPSMKMLEDVKTKGSAVVG